MAVPSSLVWFGSILLVFTASSSRGLEGERLQANWGTRHFPIFDEVVGDHTQTDPSPHAIHSAIPASRQSVTPFDGADPAFASRAPHLTLRKPSAPL